MPTHLFPPFQRSLKIWHSQESNGRIEQPVTKITRQVYNLFQEYVEQPPLGFSIAEEKKIRQLRSTGKNQTGSNITLHSYITLLQCSTQ